MVDEFEWKEEFVTGNEEVDNEHKKLFADINKLYEMFSDTKKYGDQIPALTKHLEFTMVEHFEIENNIMQKFNIANTEEHMQAHNELKQSFNEINNYNLPPIMSALLLCDIIIRYFLNHFQGYDKTFILELNKKIQSEP